MVIGHNSDYNLSFYNDRVKEIIDASIVAEPFTYIPIIAGQMELVGGNALVFGKITEGYDVVDDIQVSSEITYIDIGSTNPQLRLALYAYETERTLVPMSGGRVHATIKVVLVLVIPDQIYEGATYYVSINNTAGESYSGSYVPGIGDSLTDVKAGLESSLTGGGIDVVAGSPSNQIYMWEQIIEQDYSIFLFFLPDMAMSGYVYEASIYPKGYTLTFNNLKCGATHGYAIVYKDRAGRQCSVMKTNLMNINIPFYSESGGPKLEERVAIKFKISHKPPSWAETYEIVYYGNISMDYFMQIRADNIYGLGNNRYSINITDTFEWTQNKNNRWKVPAYSWEEGDRLRLVGTIDAGTGYGQAIGSDFVYDYEIEATGTQYDEEAVGGDWLIVQAAEHPTIFEGATNIIVEVYRPRKGLGITTPYGTGMVFDIGIDANGYKYHKGNIDQTFSAEGIVITPAEVNNTAHDCYKLIRLNYKHSTNIIYPFWADSIFPSDWWKDQIISNKLTSQGFPFLDDLSQRQTVLDERIRHGGFLITGTRTNNIAHFTYDDFMDLPKKNGDITGLREVGFTLKVIQMYKETSIYINRIQTFNPDGTEQFTLTDKFLAEQRPMETDYGCQHPDSVTVNGRNLYYWDNSQGAFIRSAPNGQISLSGAEYKMSRWFKDLSKWIHSDGSRSSLVVNIGANNDFEEVWITFRIGSTVKGIIFSEKKGRYISEIDQITESYLHLGNFFAHLYNQKLWIMNIDEGQNFLSWAGTDTEAEFEVVSNMEPSKNKVFNAIAIIADHLLESVAKSTYIPEEASAVNEIMETNIPIFDRREGIYYGKIMRDENSKGVFASTISKKLNGREMRGRYCFVKLTTDEHTEKVRVDSVVIFSTLSERNI